MVHERGLLFLELRRKKDKVRALSEIIIYLYQSAAKIS